jgi:FlaA1/EpsC-like NDP-sugar epimerase
MLRSAVVRLSAFLGGLPQTSKVALMIALDAVFVPLCLFIAVALRVGSIDAALESSPWLQVSFALCALPVLSLAGLYRTVVRYADLRVLARACTALAFVLAVAFTAVEVLGWWNLPSTAVVIFWFVASGYLVCSRVLAGMLLRIGAKKPEAPRIALAIYGAGDAGVQFARAMQFSKEYKPVCFLDDGTDRVRRSVGGLPVYPADRLLEAVDRHDVAQVVVAIPSTSAARRRALIQKIETVGVPIKTVPSLSEIVDGKASVNEIREVDVADLLGRDPVAPDPTLFSRCLTGKVVMVTGAGGSIGSELCRQVLTQNPRKLVVLEHSEIALYEIEQELARLGRGVPLHAVLGSVLDQRHLVRVMRSEGVQTVYHAAAYKHVPIVEANVRVGLVNNALGTQAVAEAAREAGVETCVLISTDKAVRPTNLMGASKRIAELIFQAAALRSPDTVFSMVRFGNVLGSSGSVVPLFRRQIRSGSPITITHPDIVRYFMLIPEAAQLVIQAGAMARGGDVFVLDMGEPVRIIDLARSMIRLSGLTERTAEVPDGDIEIRAVGLRPGEKLYEELLIGGDIVPSGHPRIMSARERHVDPALLDKMLSSLRAACEQNDEEQILRLVRNLVPEFRLASEVNAEAVLAGATR